MGKYNEVEGNLITLALEGAFDVVVHGCNCFCTMGAGIAPHMAKAFGCDEFPLEEEEHVGDMNKLGCIEFGYYNLPDGKRIYPVNAYTQYGFGRNHKEGSTSPVDYDAVTLCMRKLNNLFAGKHIGLPLIGCGLAGGIWDVNALTDEDIIDADPTIDFNNFTDIKTIIQRELKDCEVTIVHFKQPTYVPKHETEETPESN